MTMAAENLLPITSTAKGIFSQVCFHSNLVSFIKKEEEKKAKGLKFYVQQKKDCVLFS